MNLFANPCYLNASSDPLTLVPYYGDCYGRVGGLILYAIFRSKYSLGVEVVLEKLKRSPYRDGAEVSVGCVDLF